MKCRGSMGVLSPRRTLSLDSAAWTFETSRAAILRGTPHRGHPGSSSATARDERHVETRAAGPNHGQQLLHDGRCQSPPPRRQSHPKARFGRVVAALEAETLPHPLGPGAARPHSRQKAAIGSRSLEAGPSPCAPCPKKPTPRLHRPTNAKARRFDRAKCLNRWLRGCATVPGNTGQTRTYVVSNRSPRRSDGPTATLYCITSPS